MFVEVHFFDYITSLFVVVRKEKKGNVKERKRKEN